MSEVFHPGEEAVQKRAGVFEQAAQLGTRIVQPALSDDFAQFLASEPVMPVSHPDARAPAGIQLATLPTDQ